MYILITGTYLLPSSLEYECKGSMADEISCAVLVVQYCLELPTTAVVSHSVEESRRERAVNAGVDKMVLQYMQVVYQRQKQTRRHVVIAKFCPLHRDSCI